MFSWFISLLLSLSIFSSSAVDTPPQDNSSGDDRIEADRDQRKDVIIEDYIVK